MTTRTVHDLDGNTFEVPDPPPIPAAQTLTHRLLAVVQSLLCRLDPQRAPNLCRRLTRMETYLIERYNRPTAEEREVFEMMAELGGES